MTTQLAAGRAERGFALSFIFAIPLLAIVLALVGVTYGVTSLLRIRPDWKP